MDRLLQKADDGWLPLLSALFFASGFTSLTFEVLWTRLLASVVGTTAVAMTCVFAVFILCMSLGAALASRVRIYGRRALRVYGGLEFAIGLLGALVTLLLLHYSTPLAHLLESLPVSGSIVYSLVATFLVVGLPTILMGATLPMMLNGVKGRELPRRVVTKLYGVNILGGACGALAAGFVLVWRLGVTGTGLFALGLNALIALAALLLSNLAARPDSAPAAAETRGPGGEPEGGGGEVSYRRWWYLGLGFACGLVALQYELLWGRLAKFLLGDRTMATSALLFIYLTCMAFGSLEVRRIDELRREHGGLETFTLWGLVVGAAAAGHLLAVLGVHEVLAGDFLGFLVGRGDSLGRVAVTFMLAFAPVALLGLAFPYLLHAAREVNELPGETVGRLYFVNSVGSALGAVLGGYLIPRTLGTLPGFLCTSVLLGVLGIACIWQFSEGRRRVGFVASVVVAVALGWLALPANLYFYDDDKRLVDAHEDEYGIQIMTRDEQGHLNVKNNKISIAYKLGPRITSYVQAMLAYEPCLVSESCERIFNIGTGYGVTAGAFTHFGGVETIKTVEVIPYLFRNQRAFEPYNFGYVDHPAVERLLGDGRRVLTYDDGRYDVIAVNVFDPYVPGSSRLFTTNFWRMAKGKLAEGGVYAQLLYGADNPLLTRGLERVFSTVLLFPAYKNSHIAVAFDSPAERAQIHPGRITDRMRRAMASMGVEQPVPHLRERLEKAEARADRVAAKSDPAAQLHTENWPLLEYRWSQGYDGVSMFDSLQALDYE